MRVLLTGASGFVGQAVLHRLLDEGHHVHALSHTRPIPFTHPRLTPFQGKISDNGQSPSRPLRDAAAGCNAAIHLVGIIREDPAQGVTFTSAHVDATRVVIDACRAYQVRRYLHMSALGTRPAAVAEYHRTKFEAEQLVRASGLDWTIFRPGMITPSDPAHPGEFAQMLRNWQAGKALPYFFLPYFRRGLLGLGRHSLVQPVALNDVAAAFVAALTTPISGGRCYDLVGPERFTWPDLYRRLLRFLGFPPATLKPAIPVPIWYAKLLTRLLPASWLPFNLSQVQMAAEDNTGDPTPFATDFTWTPTPTPHLPPAPSKNLQPELTGVL